MSSVTGMVTTLEASEMLGRPRDYGYVHRLAARGKLRKIEWSPRIFLYPKDDVERVAREQARKLAKVA